MDMNREALRIRAFRKLKGLTQAQLADKLDISVSVIGAVERGTRKAGPQLIRKIAEVLGVEEGELTACPHPLIDNRRAGDGRM